MGSQEIFREHHFINVFKGWNKYSKRMWCFEEGVVSNQANTYSNLKQRIYHVRYINEDGDLRRVVSASLVFIDEGGEEDNLKKWAEEPDDTPYQKKLSFVSTMSKVVAIMDFRASENDDYDPASDIKQHENEIELMVNGTDENNYLHLAYFEKYIKEAGVDVCLCSSRNDDEAINRLSQMNLTNCNKICQEPTQESGVPQEKSETEIQGSA